MFPIISIAHSVPSFLPPSHTQSSWLRCWCCCIDVLLWFIWAAVESIVVTFAWQRGNVRPSVLPEIINYLGRESVSSWSVHFPPSKWLEERKSASTSVHFPPSKWLEERKSASTSVHFPPSLGRESLHLFIPSERKSCKYTFSHYVEMMCYIFESTDALEFNPHQSVQTTFEQCYDVDNNKRLPQECK